MPNPLILDSKASTMVTVLSSEDLAILRQSLAGCVDSESSARIKLTSLIWPPKGLPDGLYRDVIRARVGKQYSYYAFSIFFNLALVAQIMIGAALTALGATARKENAPLTVLAACNTALGGLLALMHNSGLPHRYQNDWNEFEEVEMYLKELMDTGVVKDSKEGVTRAAVIADCYRRFEHAKKTVKENSGSHYIAPDRVAAKDGDGSHHE
ncbi:hypothetical protein B7494_g5951 [Chlorociboria aeruginascens]|nr:hypothetical protein B7494_g5951 [Chlorociboria aeruginascens]